MPNVTEAMIMSICMEGNFANSSLYPVQLRFAVLCGMRIKQILKMSPIKPINKCG